MRGAALFVLGCALMCLPQRGAWAQDAAAPRPFQALPNIVQTDPAQPHCGASARLRNGELLAELDIAYADYAIFNPRTGVNDNVHLRSYNGCPYGPTITLHPSQTIRLTVKNDLPPAEPTFNCVAPVSPAGATPPPESHANPDCFNTTNIHFHGLHVSPSGNSDNVFIAVRPGGQFEYEINVPADHPSGTYWYHSHRHGSTAIDVSSGMEGVIIIRGDRKVEDRARNNNIADIDTILVNSEGRRLREHTFLFQQIEYGCFDSPTDTVPIADPQTKLWTCTASQAGEIRGYVNQLTFVGAAGKSSWEESGRFTQINGQVQPQYPPAGETLRAGQVERWRLVHGGIRDTINMKIVKATTGPDAAGTTTGTAAFVQDRLFRATDRHARQQILNEVCGGATVEQEEFALDGLTQSAFHETDTNVLQPGYRSDVLVAFPTAGIYCLLDEAADVSATLQGGSAPNGVKDRRLLGLVQVAPGSDIPGMDNPPTGHTPYWAYIRDQLIAANPQLPDAVKAALNTMTIADYAPIAAIAGPANVKQPDRFDIDIGAAGPSFTINENHYDPNRIDYAAVVGSTDQWTLTNNGASHVFHIHVNPFQITDILDPAGKSIIDASGHCTEMDLPTPDPQYCGLIGAVRDTVFIKGGPARAPSGYTVVMRTRYDRYVGEFVMHCHILDHEDQGMMENVLIVPATGDLPVQTASATPAPDGAVGGSPPASTPVSAPAGLASPQAHH